MTENRTVWKSDSQEDKEETSIQTGRREGDGQPERRRLAARQRLGDLARWRIVEREGQAAGSRPHKVVAGRPCGPTFARR